MLGFIYLKKLFLLVIVKIFNYWKILERGVFMQRNPIDQFLKDPDNKAKLFIWLTRSMIIVTFMITIGTIIFILYLLGFIS